MTDQPWPTVQRLTHWLDENATTTPEATRLLRILKLQEEVGEVAQAVVGAMNANPRKGSSHTWTDVEAELCDVIITAMVALTTLTPDPEQTFHHHLTHVAQRSLT